MSSSAQSGIGAALPRCFVIGALSACTLDVSGLAAPVDDAGASPAHDAGAAPLQDGGELAPDAGGDACIGLACVATDAGCDGVESCNALDDDCDGAIDEGDALCGETCTTAVFGGSAYLFCSDTSNWEDSREHCTDRGYDLVIVGDEPENAFVTATANAVRPGEWWIGLRSPKNDGMYEWVDGRDPEFAAWETDMPTGECVRTRTSDGLWQGKGCGGSRAFVCEPRR